MGSHNKKHLHQLLTEDQEPFHLQTFIADRRRSHLKSTTTTTTTTAVTTNRKKPKSIINHVCLFSFHDSPDFTKSPFLDFPASNNNNNKKSPFLDFPASNNNKSPNNAAATAVFLHIPARTAAMLLDAATRVQNQNRNKKPGFSTKAEPGSSKQTGFGLLGSLLRRLKLKDRNSTRVKTSCELNGETMPFSASTRRGRKKTEVNGNGDGDEKRLSNSCCENGRVSSSVNWSEKSSEMETSCSSRSIIEEIERENCCYCENPMSPFRFSLERSPSPARRRPESMSPVGSPSRHFQQDKENYDGEHPKEIHVEEEDKEKEQCSPVSVLDPLFDDDEEEHDGGPTEQDGYDMECSYASVERAKHQLLQKLQRFERLAGLDPIELEKHMLDCYTEDDDDDEDIIVDEEEMTNEEYVKEIFNHLGVGKIPWYMKKLVYDLITEENKNNEPQVLVQRVCKRLHSWKVVELNTIDMMVETEFKSEGWKRCDEEKIKETGMDLEASIFGFLVEELVQELVKSSDNVIFTK